MGILSLSPGIPKSCAGDVFDVVVSRLRTIAKRGYETVPNATVLPSSRPLLAPRLCVSVVE
jgi:hypothetical protein